MIFQNSTEKEKIILDGQQRLATVTILLAAIRDILHELADSETAQDIQKHFIIDKFLKKEIKRLTLNIRNKEFFEYCIQKFPTDKDKESFEDYEKNNKLSKTNKLIKNAYLFFKDKLEKGIKDKVKNDKISFLTNICTEVSQKFIVIMILVDSEEEAYLIFETINDRGLELSVSDLFKNYLIRKANVKDKEDVIRIWQEIANLLDAKIRPFLRHYWSSKYQLITERNLFSMLKEYVEQKKLNVKNFVKELKEEAEIYSALLKPDFDFWKDKEITYLLNDFNMLNISQCLIIFMAARKNFNNKNFREALDLVINFSFRYSTICNLHSNELERRYSDVARKIRNKAINSMPELKKILIDIYPDDKSFTSSFNSKDILDTSIARYILKKIDIELTGQTEKFDYEKLSLEHILPKSPNEDWISFFKKRKIDLKKESKALVFKIGNLTLLDVSMNRIAANSFFTEKRNKFYKKSNLKINQKLKKLKEWNEKEILKRQQEFGEIAKNIWKI